MKILAAILTILAIAAAILYVVEQPVPVKIKTPIEKKLEEIQTTLELISIQIPELIREIRKRK